MIPYYILFAALALVGSCTSEDQLLTGDGSGFEPPPIIEISVELVSKRVFDPEKNASNLKIVKATIDDYSRKENIRYPSDNIKRSIVNHGGKFAVFFNMKDDTRCDEVRRFVKGAREHSIELSYAVLKCEGEKTEII